MWKNGRRSACTRVYGGWKKSTTLCWCMSENLLSYFSEEKKRKYIEETNLKQFADGTIVDKKQLLEVLQMAKKEGHTISYSELENHTAAIAAPIFANDGTVVAGISISGLAIEYSESNIPYFIAKVKETANRISKELGFWHRKRE